MLLLLELTKTKTKPGKNKLSLLPTELIQEIIHKRVILYPNNEIPVARILTELSLISKEFKAISENIYSKLLLVLRKKQIKYLHRKTLLLLIETLENDSHRYKKNPYKELYKLEQRCIELNKKQNNDAFLAKSKELVQQNNHIHSIIANNNCFALASILEEMIALEKNRFAQDNLKIKHTIVPSCLM